MDFRGFDSSIILILRGGILMSIGDFPESGEEELGAAQRDPNPQKSDLLCFNKAELL